MNDSLDLHTFSPKEAADLVDEYLRASFEAGLTSVRIIHGKGTSRLKHTVESVLAKHPNVVAYVNAPEHLGGWGATVVTLGIREPADAIAHATSEPPAQPPRPRKRDRVRMLWTRFSPLFSVAFGLAMALRMRTQYGQVRVLLVLLAIGLLIWLIERRLRNLQTFGRFAGRTLLLNVCWFLWPFYLRSMSLTAGHVAAVSVLILLTLAWEFPFLRVRLERSLRGEAVLRAVAVFYFLNMALPTVLGWSLSSAWWGASAAAVTILIAALFKSARPVTWKLGAALITTVTIAFGRSWFPPVPMVATEISVTPERPQMPPGEVTVRSSILAPQGLRDGLVHIWRHGGKVTDRIPLEITGGRREGFRTWSRKQAWPKDPSGQWTIEVRTNDGRLLGKTTFKVQSSKGNTDRAE